MYKVDDVSKDHSYCKDHGDYGVSSNNNNNMARAFLIYQGVDHYTEV